MSQQQKTIIDEALDDLPQFVTMIGSPWVAGRNVFGDCTIFIHPGPPPPFRLHLSEPTTYTEEIVYAGGIWEFTLDQNPDGTWTLILSTALGDITVQSTPGGGPFPFGIYSFGDGCNEPPDYTITP